MDIQRAIDQFLSAPVLAVAGASQNRSKYGNKVLRCYLQNGRKAIPVNPGCHTVEDQPCFASLSDINEPIQSLSVITSPHITDGIVSEAIEKGIPNIWMQPGAESITAVELARAAGLNVISGGPCVFVVLGYSEQQ